LFRVRNKKTTKYCYSEEEKLNAMSKLGKDCEVTRFKGLGEISPDEFKQFIGAEIKLTPVRMSSTTNIEDLLSYYMGKNTPSRQDFIIDNLRVELDELEEEEIAV
jgi:topoisomerase-4 subunit B